MRRCTILPVSAEAIEYLCAYMRAADKQEIKASVGFFDPDFIKSTILDKGEIGCVGLNKHGLPFFAAGLLPAPVWSERDAYAFGTDELAGQVVIATKECRRVLRDALDLGITRINAYTQVTHANAHKWMELIGFRNAESLPGFGKDGSDFYRFELI